MSSSPPPRQIDSWQAAEQNAAAWMRYWGFFDARITTSGSDAGIDVWATWGLAQVKWEATQVGRPALQRLAGARENSTQKELLFFCGAGYAAPAVDYANRMNIALFKYDLAGRQSPMNGAAREVVARAARAQGETRLDEARPQAVPPSQPRSDLDRFLADIFNAVWRFAAPHLRRFGVLIVGGLALVLATVWTIGHGSKDFAGVGWYEPLIAATIGVALIGGWIWYHRQQGHSGSERERDT